MKPVIRSGPSAVIFLLVVTFLAAGCAGWRHEPGLIPAGAARVDISPTHAVRLMGYAARAQQPAPTQLLQPIHARALALGADPEASVLITIDNCILPAAVTEEVRQRLARRLAVAPERIALTVTHTHSAPCLTGAAPNIFGVEISAADQEAIDAYTRFLTDCLEEVAVSAMKNRQPARLAWGQGTALFAKNRRTAGGPVDHDLPLLRVTTPDGRLRAVFVSYACHCTTLGGEINATHGDWAGVAALAIERDHPDSVALVAIGCGADSNPDPRGTVELVNRHGEAIATESSRLLSLPLTPLTNAPIGRLKTLALPFQPHFTRAEWEQRATLSGIVGHHARKWLARMDRGETLPLSLPYPIQTWVFGDQLAMVFLGGEVVVDYSLRLKKELDPTRVWINAYANDVPCYIPSRRILAEGGYEAETSLWYYDRPQRLSPEIEDLIVATVRDLVPASFRMDAHQAERPPPKSLPESQAAFRVAPGFQVDLVAGEPLVDTPVAIDFGADGRLWVCEMRDYPSGLDGQGKPGGRVTVLTDTNGDGRFDHSEVIADGLPFLTGLMAWRDGVLVCAAPDIWQISPLVAAEGTRRTIPLSSQSNDQASASSRPRSTESGPITGCSPAPGWKAERLLSGFATHNFQARVNGLRWGLDGWVYGSGSLFGGMITVAKTGATVDCRNRDFRFRPDTGGFEALAGVSQQGRIRDDFDQWFGNDNSTLLWHFPIPDRYLRRNPHAAAPGARRILPGEGDIGRVFPVSRTLTRFNDPHAANHLTSACGPELYRDDFLGPRLSGNAFVCEPVHNLVRRAIVEPDGPSFRTRRDPAETTSEFVASTDNWFRPVEVRTGPDGALWVVDMHRFVVEHPRWISPERLRDLDVRAGEGTGRIWRITPTGRSLPPIRDLTRLKPAQLVALLESSNGVERDLAHRLLLSKAPHDPHIQNELRRLAHRSSRPATQAQALALLAALNGLTPGLLADALHADDPRLRRFAVSLAEINADQSQVPAAVLSRVQDPDPGVRFQLALTLGDFTDPAAGRALAQIAVQDGANPWTRAAILSSVLASPESLAAQLAAETREREALAPLRLAALDSWVAAGQTNALGIWLTTGFTPGTDLPPLALSEALHLLASLATRPDLADALRAGSGAVTLAGLQRQLGGSASALARDFGQPEVVRLAAVALLGESARSDPARRRELLELLDLDGAPTVRTAAVTALRRQEDPALASQLLAGWPQRPPGQRAALIGVLLSRESWTDTLLTAVEEQIVSAPELSPTQRQQLQKSDDPVRRDRASRMFPSAESDRAQVVARFDDVNRLAGDPAQGGAHFERLCASCHFLRGTGHEVGPDLATFRSKPSADFLVALLDPNAAVEPRFTAWTADLRDGRSVTGLVRDETSASLTLVEPGGVRQTLKRSEVTRLAPSPLSLMPEGLEAGLSPAQLADLIAWLKQTPAPFGEASPAQVATARTHFQALSPQPLAQLESNSDALPYPSWMGSLPLHYCRATDGASRVQWQLSGTQGPWRIPAAMGFASQPPGSFTLFVNGRAALDFGVSLDDARWSGPDGTVELRYRVQEHNTEDSNGVLELELAPSWLTPGQPVTLEVRGSSSASQRWFGLYDTRSLVDH